MPPMDRGSERRSVGTGEYSELYGQLQRLGEINDELGNMLAQIRDMMKDSVVVDLGAGEADVMPQLAKDAGAKQYIGVDIRPRKKPPIEGATYVNEDVVSFLERGLPPGRHIIICSGFDHEVTGLDYGKLAGLVDKETKKRDVIFGFETPSLEAKLLAMRDEGGRNIFRKAYEYPGFNFFVIAKDVDR
jgi:hypothetical protein